MIDNILDTAPNIIRTITKNPQLHNQHEKPRVNLGVLSGTSYGKLFSDFDTKMNNLSHAIFKVELVKSTIPSINQLLFQNCVIMRETTSCTSGTLRKVTGTVTSSVTNKAYKVNKTLNCNDGWIYVVTGGCEQQ